jgi:transketolase
MEVRKMFNVEIKKPQKEMRMAVVEALQDLMKVNDKVIAIDADLAGASGWNKIKKSNPDRFIDVGIAESNMAGIAAGLSAAGFIPFIHSFAPFATRRAYDQIFVSGAYAKNTINIFGSDPGFTVGPNGGTHTSFEDIALMRVIPKAIVCDVCDPCQMNWTIKQFAGLSGIHYVRGCRKAVTNIYKEGSTFELGKGNILKEGKDVLIIVSGFLVHDALCAAEILEKENGLSVEVVDMFTIKPLDEDLIKKEISGKKAVLTVENHSVIGGLGAAVAEYLAENFCTLPPFRRMGIRERFGETGSVEYLQESFGLTAKDIVKTTLGLIK